LIGESHVTGTVAFGGKIEPLVGETTETACTASGVVPTRKGVNAQSSAEATGEPAAAATSLGTLYQPFPGP
jgi:hypothetical protein